MIKPSGIIVFILAFMLVISSYSQAGTLDVSFNADGLATVSNSSLVDFGNVMAIQSDGKILVAGKTGASDDDIMIVRLNVDGSIDSTFSSDGILTDDVYFSDDEVNGMIVQPDGKIVVVGSCINLGGGNHDFFIARYLSNGYPDGFFGSGGKTITTFGPDDEFANSVVIQSDGKLVVAGHAAMTFNYDFAVARYNTDGTLDNSFGTGGKVTTDIGMSSNVARSVRVQSDGKIIAGGIAWNGSFIGDYALIRYNTDGSLDNSFSSDGIQTAAIGSDDDLAYAMAIQSDGKIVLAGHSFNGTDYDFSIARFNTNGSLDNSFSGDGKQITPFGSNNDIGKSVVIQPDGNIIVGGYTNVSGTDDFGLIRYTPSGNLDNSFDTDGKVITHVSSGNDNGMSLALQPDGKILLAGTSDTSSIDFVVARYLDTVSTSSLQSAELNLSVEVYPNPFVNEMNINYCLQKPMIVSMEIVDSKGNLVYSVFQGNYQFDGQYNHKINFDSKDLATGEYYLCLRGDNQTIVRKIVKQN